jgi:CheY-like chemotaxis protein
MNKETQMCCLEPFFTTKEAGKGTGLGLSTVYAITQKCDGHLRLTSDIGKGTTFTLYFPREKAKLEMRPAVIERPEIRLGSETIMVVEDDTMVRYMIREIMKKTGYNILEAANGEEALLKADRHDGKIALIITDVVMPQMNGRELVEKLTESRPELKAIYISGYTHEAIMKYGLGNIDGAFMQKPFASAALISKVREVLDQPAHNPVPPTTPPLEANL